MKEFVGRLLGCVFLGSFCLAGPLLLILALGTAVQRAALLISGAHAEATVVGAQQSPGSTRPTYAPVFQFTAATGRSYTVSSDVYGQESSVHFGERIPILYRPSHPEAARIDAFAALWTLPLVAGIVGAGFSIVPAILLVAWMRRRAAEGDPDKREKARIAAETVGRALQRALGILLIGAGGVSIAFGLGVIPISRSAGGVHIMATAVGVLLIASGVQVGQWVNTGGRLYNVFGSVMAMAMAVMFGWVAIYGDAANFRGGVGFGRTAVALGGSAAPARMVFGLACLLAGGASLWAWKQVFRPR